MSVTLRKMKKTKKQKSANEWVKIWNVRKVVLHEDYKKMKDLSNLSYTS
mgnify:CR=1 FL=1